MAGMVKTRLQLAKQRLKFSRTIRLVATPYMLIKTKRADDSFKSSKDGAYIRSLEGLYAGRRCFIIGNGPSLRAVDLDKLSGEVSFAANGILRIFDQTAWRPTFYVCIDQNFISLEGASIPGIEAGHIFLDGNARGRVDTSQGRITLINEHRERWSTSKFTTSAIGFSHEPDRYISAGYTVTYAAMQLAIYMGFDEIYLLGVDHTYGRTVTSDGRISKGPSDNPHFFKGGTEGYYYFEGVEYAYHLANVEAAKKGCRIYNATRGGRLEEFDRVDFDTLFAASDGFVLADSEVAVHV